MNAPMKNATHELVRDLFVFSVFTGLAYSDVKNLTTDRLRTFPDGTTVDFEGCIFDIKNCGAGDSTNVGPLEFDVVANGKPTVTPAV